MNSSNQNNQIEHRRGRPHYQNWQMNEGAFFFDYHGNRQAIGEMNYHHRHTARGGRNWRGGRNGMIGDRTYAPQANEIMMSETINCLYLPETTHNTEPSRQAEQSTSTNIPLNMLEPFLKSIGEIIKAEVTKQLVEKQLPAMISQNIILQDGETKDKILEETKEEEKGKTIEETSEELSESKTPKEPNDKAIISRKGRWKIPKKNAAKSPCDKKVREKSKNKIEGCDERNNKGEEREKLEETIKNTNIQQTTEESNLNQTTTNPNYNAKSSKESLRKRKPLQQKEKPRNGTKVNRSTEGDNETQKPKKPKESRVEDENEDENNAAKNSCDKNLRERSKNKMEGCKESNNEGEERGELEETIKSTKIQQTTEESSPNQTTTKPNHNAKSSKESLRKRKALQQKEKPRNGTEESRATEGYNETHTPKNPNKSMVEDENNTAKNSCDKNGGETTKIKMEGFKESNNKGEEREKLEETIKNTKVQQTTEESSLNQTTPNPNYKAKGFQESLCKRKALQQKENPRNGTEVNRATEGDNETQTPKKPKKSMVEDEIEELEVMARKAIEEARTKAVVKKCSNCKKPIFTVDLCNIILCKCGEWICYSCETPMKNNIKLCNCDFLWPKNMFKSFRLSAALNEKKELKEKYPTLKFKYVPKKYFKGLETQS